MKRIVLLLPFVLAMPAEGQQTVSANPTAAVSAAKAMWQAMTNYITAAAEQMPEKDYAFRPTHDVRTFGQMIGHVAGAQNLICGSALGETTVGEDNIEKSKTTKADLTAALKASTANCARAYAQSDAKSAGMIKLFGQDQTRLFALMLNATHNAEHYGNIVTYMRMKGMVPPSSQPAPPRP